MVCLKRLITTGLLSLEAFGFVRASVPSLHRSVYRRSNIYTIAATVWVPLHDAVIFASVRLHLYIIFSIQLGVSALMYAAGRGHTKVLTQLLEAGANIDLQSTKVVCKTCTVCVCGVL